MPSLINHFFAFFLIIIAFASCSQEKSTTELIDKLEFVQDSSIQDYVAHESNQSKDRIQRIEEYTEFDKPESFNDSENIEKKIDARICSPEIDYLYKYRRLESENKNTFRKYISDYLATKSGLLFSHHNEKTFASGTKNLFSEIFHVDEKKNITMRYSYADHRIRSVSKVKLIALDHSNYFEFITVNTRTFAISRSIDSGKINGNLDLVTNFVLPDSIRPAINKADETFIAYSTPKTISSYSFNKEKHNINWNYELESNVICSPSLDLEGNIYTCTSNGTIYSITSKGTLNWKRTIGIVLPARTFLSIGKNKIYISYENKITGINKADGKTEWIFSKIEIESGITTSPFGSLWAGTRNGVIALTKDGTVISNVNLYKRNTSPPTILDDQSVLAYHKDGIAHIDKFGVIQKVYKIEKSTILLEDQKIYTSKGNIYTKFRNIKNEEGFLIIRGACTKEISNQGWPTLDGSKLNHRKYE